MVSRQQVYDLACTAAAWSAWPLCGGFLHSTLPSICRQHLACLATGGENQGRLRKGLLDSLTTPIVQTSTYTFKNTAELIAYQEGRHNSFEYGRYGNPTVRVVEEKIMALEGAEDCLLSSSGAFWICKIRLFCDADSIWSALAAP